MPEITELRFRTAVGGFHKSDVTEYITKTAARHKAELAGLEQENERLWAQLEEATKKLEALQPPEEASEQPEEDLPESPSESHADTITSLELAAYRRAEQAERTANNRAKQLYQQLEQIGQDSQQSLAAAREATELVLCKLSEYLQQLQTPYQNLVQQLNSAEARLEAMADMNPDPAEGMEEPHE